MFGVSRKKLKATKEPLSFAVDEDDDDASDPRPREERRRKLKEKKKKDTSSAMLSFDPDENDAERHEHKERKRKKHSKREDPKKRHKEKTSRSGMGYGGMMMVDEDEAEVHSDDNLQRDEDKLPGSLYDKAALEKLKMEQKHRLNEKVDESSRDDAANPLPTNTARKSDNTVEDNEEEFIPLSGSNIKDQSTQSDPIVLTGDEAIAYATKDDAEPVEFDHGLEQPPTAPQKIDLEEQPQEMEEDTRQWEDTMARRAGVLPPTSASSSKPKREEHNKAIQTSLSQIKASLQPTITNLQNVSADLETALHRHESNLSSAKDELSKHQSTLEDHGAALEYYQELRQDLADWMGALRQIKGMVDAVTEARSNLEGSITMSTLHKWWEWSEDVTNVLKRNGLLEKTIGGEDIEEEEVGVDEFGRDLSSMTVMARTKRWEARRRNFLQKAGADAEEMSLQEIMMCTNVDNTSFEEIEEWLQRKQALLQATNIIPSIVNDDYLSLTNLCSLFFRWQERYPEDYKNCYAEMSLVGMISVLTRLELCRSWDGLGLRDCLQKYNSFDDHATKGDLFQSLSDVEEFCWFKDLQQALMNRAQGSFDSKLLVEVTEKCIISQLLAYLTIPAETNDAKNTKYQGLYDPVSVTQTKWMCSSFTSAFECILRSDSNSDLVKSTRSKVATLVLSLLKYCVDKKSTPIVKTSTLLLTKHGFVLSNGIKDLDAETNDAVAYALYSQANELSMLATNILNHWLPIINGTQPCNEDTPIVQFILMEVISLRILPVLHLFKTKVHEVSSDDERQPYLDMHKRLLGGAFDAVKTSGLFNKAEFMLCTAPLRAASQTIDLI
jgi:hypothetical protein